MDKFIKKLLDFFNLNVKEFKDIVADVSNDIFNFVYQNEYFNNAKKLVEEAINENRKILIYGDYDTDGILSSAIIANSIYLKYKIIPKIYIPDREIDGYGLTLNNSVKFIEEGYNFFILVDNGITLKENVEYLKENNAKVLIIDHHEIIDNKLSKPDALIHYKFISEFNNINISAGGLSALFSIVLLERIESYLIVLGSVSIVSDMMPMIGFNHQFVKRGLNILNKEERIPQITSFYILDQKLTNKLKLVREIDEWSLALHVIPKINSVGRIEKGEKILCAVDAFLLYKVKNNAEYIYCILQTNNKRVEMLENLMVDSYINGDDSYNFLYLEDSKEGLIGLIANRILQTNNKPTFVLTKNKNTGHLKGSARSTNGFSIIDFLSSNKSLFINYGGHAYAGGFELEEDNISLLKDKISDYLKINPINETVKKKCIDITYNEVNQMNYRIIKSLKPFGKDFDKPIFRIKNISPFNLNLSKDGNHIITKLSLDTNLVYFNFPKELLNEKEVDFIGRIEKHIYREKIMYQFFVENYEISQ